MQLFICQQLQAQHEARQTLLSFCHSLAGEGLKVFSSALWRLIAMRCCITLSSSALLSALQPAGKSGLFTASAA